MLEVGNINDRDSDKEWLDANDLDGDTTRNTVKTFDFIFTSFSDKKTWKL